MELEIVQPPAVLAEKWLTEYMERANLQIKENRVTFSLDELRKLNSKCVQQIIRDPTPFHRLVRDWIKNAQLHKAHTTEEKEITGTATIYKEPTVRVSFEGNLGSNFVSPRGLSSRMANQLVGIQGIVTKMSVKRSQLSKSIHWCDKTSTEFIKEYPDRFAPEQQLDIKKNKTIPKEDNNKNPYAFEYGKSTFKDIQTMVVQQLPEMAPPGQLPRSVTVYTQDDLIDRVKPGDRVQLIGIYRLHAGNMARTSGVFKSHILCTSIINMSQQAVCLIPKTSVRCPFPEKNLLLSFTRSICPAVSGHQQVKKAILLMLLGGNQKNLENGTHLRGDINLLLVGDPGTAKSQMLRWVLNTVDIGINTTGSGASGVGLTAAITMDQESGERNIEAGAMVLADRGFVCIDEFDKMNEDDRVAVHEVMEQQTVTIAKAGIHCSLNARCSVIAAANPIYGEYNSNLPPTKNIGMPDSLLSRFDLIFVIRDEKNAERDRQIAERVCRNHKFASIDNSISNQDYEDYVIQPLEIIDKPELMYEKSHIFQGDSKVEMLTHGYLRQYIKYCRQSITPLLTNEVVEFLASLWSLLRKNENPKGQEINRPKVLPITIRSYETLIRLSTAHAKLRLSKMVKIQDCVQAFKLLVFTLYGEEDALDREMEDLMRNIDNDAATEYASSKATSNYPSTKPTQVMHKKPIKPKAEESGSEGVTTRQNNIRLSKIKIDQEDEAISRVIAAPNNNRVIEAKSKFFLLMVNISKKIKKEVMPISMVIAELNKQNDFTEEEINGGIQLLLREDKIYYSQDRKSIRLI